MACDDDHQRELLNILKRTALRAPRRAAVKLSLVFSRSRSDDFFDTATGVNDETSANGL
jgi:hypothetical protein